MYYYGKEVLFNKNVYGKGIYFIKSKEVIIMLKYKDGFYNTFKVPLYRFIDKTLLAMGIYAFDIIGFDDYLKSIGYTEKKDGSMKDYILKTYGIKAVKLIETLNSL